MDSNYVFKKNPSLSEVYDIARRTGSIYDATCSFCNREWKAVKTGRLLQHAFECDKVSRILKDEIIKGIRSPQPSSYIKENHQMQREANYLLVDFLASSCIPVRSLCFNRFKNFIFRLQLDYKLPGKIRLRSEIILAADKSQQKALEALKKEPDYSLSIEFDVWSSRTELFLIAIGLTTSDGRSFVADLVDCSDGSSANIFYEQVMASLRSLGLRGEVHCDCYI